ncbi:MAG: 16S rRNA (cytosine(1402)-N(4))-methyltransferase RsmH [Thermaerobacterales bacterium]
MSLSAAEPHAPVMLRAVMEHLIHPDVAGGLYVDGTLGAGGHAEAILKEVPEARLLGIDQDSEALAHASARLSPFGERVETVKGNFRHLPEILGRRGSTAVTGILLDLGVSSMHFDRPERGFSYQHDGPLDMRMDTGNPVTAAQIVNTYDRRSLTGIFRQYGEERWASRIAQFVVEARERRPIETTYQLVDVIKAAIPAGARRRGPHPARRTFQALRIAVNEELQVLEEVLTAAAELLVAGGRLVVISFHSLEDRIVKHTFRSLARGCTCGEPAAMCRCDRRQLLEVLTPRPLRPDEDEQKLNPRARSALLRAARRIGPAPEPKTASF